MKILLKKSVPLLYILFFLTSLVQAQVSWNSQLKPILEDSLLKRAQVGISIRDITANTLVFEKNAQQAFTPASNLKIVTTAAALELLGSDYRFVTKVLYTGNIEAGNFSGTLYVKGSGDPTLGSDKMTAAGSYQTLVRNWVTALKNKGITAFTGNLVIDPTHFGYNAIPNDYTWGDIGNYYGAGSYGLNINENQNVIAIKPGTSLGSITTILSITPKDTSCVYVNHVKTGAAGSGDQSIVYSSPYNPFVYIEGTVPAGSTYNVKASISDPARLLGQLLTKEMAVQGIQWKGEMRVLTQDDTIPDTTNWITLLEQRSPRLKEIAVYTNLVSNNLYAECLLKEIAFNKTGIGSTELGAAAVKKYLKKIGVDTSGLVLRDGSGMSPFNSISPNQLTSLLAKQQANTVFVGCLPTAGKEGTVAHICKESGGKIRVKSGTMNGTTCYSGYVTAASGKVYAVSLMVNKHEAKNRTIQRVLEKVLLKVAEN
ncbi:D-alanyl-D-alanine carboxypeptidase/D-alanyl-D-alanine endopeptidase [Cytophaga hutchinsonii]|uniref:D-alanyl-D-alanine carboxypeptidase (Penicillin-binding protein 4) n=1 Tax=Cytophaga hutchinsonii (strain ATCC 33406 / DSM 1761 / CIP 103989 / NBRC 15051 / NCIMB 9469 / D465) TaxID=269798 RepID=A0A6N4SQM0_CYTH3|nr:D-alanyl-D-alanine carboxypeptidase/D-alanyl-D-alanine-endopeptidase [Cytophaga hutchinsonii]ABG58636.1 D-alanyl-D-alanine carboxypeptidase (penicillin-binding protein 4) [Cytophaga hutchinsonii ATCC 33406]SFX58535.1 D-alanyl-D-alanine carboxypeptidase / D-alanyl-D-alanine-endopeptidase (penicillin-binding protein 4) [Cytophaga hutchinsonii ATCC 33406]